MHVVLLYLSNVQFCGANKLNELHQKWVKNKEKLLLQPRKIYEKAAQTLFFAVIKITDLYYHFMSIASQCVYHTLLWCDNTESFANFFFALSFTSENSLLKPQYCLSFTLSVYVSPSLCGRSLSPFYSLCPSLSRFQALWTFTWRSMAKRKLSLSTMHPGALFTTASDEWCRTQSWFPFNKNFSCLMKS